MLHLNFFKIYTFSVKPTRKNSTTNKVLSSFCETTELQSFSKLNTKFIKLQTYFFQESFLIKNSREIANCLFKDMIHLTLM